METTMYSNGMRLDAAVMPSMRVELKRQLKLAKAIGWQTEPQWEAINTLYSHGVISWPVYDYVRRDRVWDALETDRAYHWHPVIRHIRMVLIGKRKYWEDWKIDAK